MLRKSKKKLEKCQENGKENAMANKIKLRCWSYLCK